MGDVYAACDTCQQMTEQEVTHWHDAEQTIIACRCCNQCFVETIIENNE